MLVLSLTISGLLAAGIGGGGRIDLAVVLYALLLLALQVFSEQTWRELTDRVAPHLDGIVTNLDERARAACWMSRRLRDLPQVWCSAMGGSGACALAVLAVHATGAALLWELPFVIAVTITGILGANVLYWLLVGAHWLWRFRTLKSLRLRSVPENDPSMQGCRTLLMHVMIRVTIGVLLCQAPLLALDSIRPSNTFLIAETMTIGLLCGITLIAITIGPALCLGHIKYVDQRNQVEELEREFDALKLTGSELLEQRCQLQLAISAILSRPRHKLDMAAFLTVASTLGAVFVPYVVSVLLQVPTLV